MLIADALILVFLAVTIFYCVRLTWFYKTFHEGREGLHGLIRSMSEQIVRAENALAKSESRVEEAENALRTLTNEARFLTDELKYYTGKAGADFDSRDEEDQELLKELTALAEGHVERGEVDADEIDKDEIDIDEDTLHFEDEEGENAQGNIPALPAFMRADDGDTPKAAEKEEDKDDNNNVSEAIEAEPLESVSAFLKRTVQKELEATLKDGAAKEETPQAQEMSEDTKQAESTSQDDLLAEELQAFRRLKNEILKDMEQAIPKITEKNGLTQPDQAKGDATDHKAKQNFYSQAEKDLYEAINEARRQKNGATIN